MVLHAVGALHSWALPSMLLFAFHASACRLHALRAMAGHCMLHSIPLHAILHANICYMACHGMLFCMSSIACYLACYHACHNCCHYCCQAPPATVCVALHELEVRAACSRGWLGAAAVSSKHGVGLAWVSNQGIRGALRQAGHSADMESFAAQ